jgi:metal-responsive CopG/Arc/MetJ family transcriptional regulator
MSKPTIELDKELWAKVQQHSEAAGYSSPQEFVQHLIEQELAKGDEAVSEEEARRKLQGIGYLDFGRDI